MQVIETTASKNSVEGIIGWMGYPNPNERGNVIHSRNPEMLSASEKILKIMEFSSFYPNHNNYVLSNI